MKARKKTIFVTLMEGLFWLAALPGRCLEFLADRAEYGFGHVLGAVVQAGRKTVSLCFAPLRKVFGRSRPVGTGDEEVFDARPLMPLVGAFYAVLDWGQARFESLAERMEFLVGGTMAVAGAIARFAWQILAIPLRLLGRLLAFILPAWFVERCLNVFGVLPDFAQAWFFSRNLWKLLFATPAIVLAVPVVVALAISQGDTAGDKLVRYRAKLELALADNDQEMVDFCIRRLDQLGHWRRERQDFRAAMLKEEEVGAQGVFPRMLSLCVTQDGDPYPPANLWVAQRLLDGDVVPEGEDAITMAERHLQQALRVEPQHVLANRLLAEIQIRRGDVAGATSRLTEVADTDDDWQVDWRLMQLHLRQGDLSAARKAARRLVIGFETRPPQAAEVPNCSTYFAWAESLHVAGEREDAFEAYLDLVATFPEDRRVGIAIRQLASLGLADRPQALRTLYAGHPQDPVLNQLLAEQLLRAPEQWADILDQLQQSKTLSHQLFERAADQLVQQQKFRQALKYYQRACALEPEAANAWNNLAWILSNTEQRHAEALEAASRAIAVRQDPDFYDTRGQIYVKLQRWAEARADLEVALNGNLTNADSTHAALAETYMALGEVDLAAAHRRRLANPATQD